MEPTVKTDKYELYLGDCLEILPHLSGIDAVITDPPYGIDLAGKGCNPVNAKRSIHGDNAPFNPMPLLGFTRLVIWGANNFSTRLPQGGWLCWDKRCSAAADKMYGSPFELAWTNQSSKFKMYRVLHGGVVNADGANTPRYHPTQKPVALMCSVLNDFSVVGERVLDPFMGSGTTGVACIKLGRKFIGIEREEKYFDIAVKRLEEIAAQGILTPVEQCAAPDPLPLLSFQ